MSERCTWKPEEDRWGDVWWESCRRGDKGFVFEEGGPKENEFAFCPFCGKPIHVEEVTE